MTFDEKYVDENYIICKEGCNAIILFKENNSEFRAYNKERKKIISYRVDGNIKRKGIISEGERCDFALYLVDEKILYLIELKGSDYPKAISQIISSIDELIIEPGVDDLKELYARIVLSKARTPDFKTSNDKGLMRKLKQINKSFDKEKHFKKRSQKMEEDI